MIKIVVVFFDLTEPASRNAKPACITKRKNRETLIKVENESKMKID